MKVIRRISAVRRFVRSARGPVVLVPTMGALHAGHAALIDRARRVAGAGGVVVVSIFVNPAQFGPKEDLSRYPRTLPADRKLCAKHGADAIFCPDAAEMYPADFSTWVNEERVSAPLCGAARPGHFRGVSTVVLKLFAITQPDAAIFGRKDYQQLAVLQRMVRDLDLAVRIVAEPTVRERDGLALSSRNAYLTPAQRAQAPILHRTLRAVRAAHHGGECDADALLSIATRTLAAAPLARIDYVELADAATLDPLMTADRPAVLALAVFFGTTRLIDNIELRARIS